MRGIVALGIALVLACSTAPAEAEGWKLEGRHVVVSIERVVSAVFVAPDASSEIPLKPTGFELSVLNASHSTNARSGTVVRSDASLPRLAADYILDNGLSFGGAVGVGYSTYKPWGSDGPGLTSYVLGPRAGYLAVITPRFAIWPRLSFTRAATRFAQEDASKSVYDTVSWQMGVDAQFAWVLAPRILFTTGPFVNLGVGGKQTVDFEYDGDDVGGGVGSGGHNESSFRSTDYGVGAGLALMF